MGSSGQTDRKSRAAHSKCSVPRGRLPGRCGGTSHQDNAQRTAPAPPGIAGAAGPRYLHPLGRGVPLGRAHLQPGVQALLQERPGLRRPAAFSHGSGSGSGSRGDLRLQAPPRRLSPPRAGKAAPGAGRGLGSAGFEGKARTYLLTCLVGLRVYFQTSEKTYWS